MLELQYWSWKVGARMRFLKTNESRWLNDLVVRHLLSHSMHWIYRLVLISDCYLLWSTGSSLEQHWISYRQIHSEWIYCQIGIVSMCITQNIWSWTISKKGLSLVLKCHLGNSYLHILLNLLHNERRAIAPVNEAIRFNLLNLWRSYTRLLLRRVEHWAYRDRHIETIEQIASSRC